MKIYKNFSQIVTLEAAYKKDGRLLKPEDLTIHQNASIVFDDNSILWVGENKQLPKEFLSAEQVDFSNHILLPEIVDNHTHLVFGGNRSDEYSMRLNGESYEAIAKAGGGILSTMKSTNDMSENDLYSLAKERIERIHSYGVGTIEIKSGYGLNFEKEYEISHIIDKLKKHFHPRIQIKNTYMAAHAVPKNFKNSNDYLTSVVIPLMTKLNDEGIIDAVDIFHEEGYFTYEDTEKLFQEATKLGLPVKVHADEFIDNDGASLACKYEALSCDHLLRTSEKGIKNLAQSKTIANLLPGTGFFLGKSQANARKLLDAGVKLSLGSDYNPGSCHCDNILLIASLSAINLKLNIAELWSAITLNSAHSLGLKDQGALVKGLKPRFSIFKTNNINEISYTWGMNYSINS